MEMAFNYCPNCGGTIRGDEMFCPRCGFPLSSISPLKFKMEETALIKQLLSYVVKIETNTGTGSGFVADPSGIVVTNYHVIEGATEIWVKFAEGIRCEVENIQAINPQIDYAILNIIPPEEYEIKSAVLGDSDTLQIGEKITVIGNPAGVFEKTVSTGIVSAMRPGDNLIQMTAPISGGSSGGPVFNEKGEVVGISVAGYEGGQNINFFVPINLIKKEIKKPIKFVWKKAFSKKICESKITSIAFHPEQEEMYILTDEPKIRVYDFNGKEKEGLKVNKGATDIFFTTYNDLGIHFPGEILFCNLKRSEKRIFAQPVKLKIPDLELKISSSAVAYNKELYLLSDRSNNILFLRIPPSEDFKVSILPIIPAKSIFYEMAYPVKKLSLIAPLIGKSPYYGIITFDGLVRIYRIVIDYVQQVGKMCVTYFKLLKEFEHAPGTKITASALSPDMSTIVIGTDNGKIKLSNFVDIRKRLNFDVVFPASSSGVEITAIAFNTKGDYLLCGNASGEISMFKKIIGGEEHG
jgi:S1-C subfamily serine protease